MGKDDGLKEFFSDDERYADVVNGLGFCGRQVIRKEDLQDLDTQTGVWRSPRFIRKQYPRQKKRIKYRDAVRKIAMGMNFAVVGIENQDEQVFDFIRCSEDSEKLKELVEHDPAYQSMEEDAFDLVVHYTASKELVQVKDYYTKGGSVDMCRALTELIEQGRAEALRALVETCREFGVTYEDALERIMDKLSMSEEEAEACLDQYWK